MKSIYIECNMGVAGDMLAAALLELLPDPRAFIDAFNRLGIPGVKVSLEKVSKCGIYGTGLHVHVDGTEEASNDVLPAAPGTHEHHTGHTHEADGHEPMHEHHHRGLESIERIIAALPLSKKVQADSLAVYHIIAAAEAKVHRKPVSKIHFHEVGEMDAITDIVLVALLLEALEMERILASPIHLGSGHVRCAHGILPVPAPATAEILKGVPVYGGEIQGELCTPTGAALLKYFVHAFTDKPCMAYTQIAYGMGKKDFPRANCLRIFSGEVCEQNFPKRGEAGEVLEDLANDMVVELHCNLDDMSGEELAFAMERLLEAGALDVYFIPIQMKKGRPAQLLACLCKPQDEALLLRLMLKYTSSFGVRMSNWRRGILERNSHTLSTAFGELRCKRGSGYGIEKEKYEYEDLARLAKARACSIADIKTALIQKRAADV